MLIELGIAINVNNNIEISKSGKKLQEELDMNVGTLKKIKNLSNNEDELMKLLGQIKG